MAYCGPAGLPLSQFLTWSLDDQEAALGWQARERLRCPSCHVNRDVWDPELGGTRGALMAGFDVCEPCAATERAMAAPQIRDQHVHGQRVVLVPNPKRPRR